MVDKYTVYPENLRKRIEAAEKVVTDIATFKALPIEEQEKEIKKLEEEGKLRPEELASAEPEPKPGEPKAGEETAEVFKEKLEKSEQKYRTLDGMMKAQGEENKFLKQQLTIIQDQMAIMRDHIARYEKATPEKQEELADVLKDDIAALEKEMDPSLVKLVLPIVEKAGRFFGERAEKEAKRVITEVSDKIRGETVLTAQERFDKDLEEAGYGDWKTTWYTDTFQEFMRQPDGGIGGTLTGDVIETAIKKNDSRTFIKALNLFTGKKKTTPQPKAGELNPEDPKVKNRIAAPPGSGVNVDKGKPKEPEMSPQEARAKLVELADKRKKGGFTGREQEYQTEYNRLYKLAQERAPA